MISKWLYVASVVISLVGCFGEQIQVRAAEEAVCAESVPGVLQEIVEKVGVTYEEVIALLLRSEKAQKFDDSLIFTDSGSTDKNLFCGDFIEKGHASLMLGKGQKEKFNWGSESAKGSAYRISEIENYLKKVFEEIKKLWGHEINPMDLFHGHMVLGKDGDLYVVFHAKEYPTDIDNKLSFARLVFGVDPKATRGWSYDHKVPGFSQRNIVLSIKNNKLRVVTERAPFWMNDSQVITPDTSAAMTLAESDFGKVIGSFNYLPGYGISDQVYFNLAGGDNTLIRIKMEKLFLGPSGSEHFVAMDLKQKLMACACAYKLEGDFSLAPECGGFLQQQFPGKFLKNIDVYTLAKGQWR
ncbi:MAG: hypothetical protein HQK50_18895 [Oligoflexia bacterium]|nr:hypothetical protein [Oligoflexia bacterium]MBF0367650.1 hypothetical protein [Oligoflexia bacterium]